MLSVQQQPALPAQRISSKARLFASSARLEKAYRETLVSLRCVHQDAKLARRQPALLANKVLCSTREAVLVQSKKVTSTQTQAYALTVRADVQDAQRINVLHAKRGSLWHRRSALSVQQVKPFKAMLALLQLAAKAVTRASAQPPVEHARKDSF